MLLSREQIKKAIDSGEINITPFDENNLKAGSYTFTLGNKVRKLKSVESIDSRQKQTDFETIEIDENGYLLQPKEFVVLESCEKIKLGKNISCFLTVTGRMSQIGLNPLGGAIFCEPGSEGGFDEKLSLETTNNSSIPIKLFPGIKIVKAIFFHVE